VRVPSSQQKPPNITSMGATSDPDIMYFHQAMKQADAKNFLDAVHNEFKDLLQRGVIEIVPAFLVPEGMKVISSVWSMRRKRRVRTREVHKYKARLNLDGSQMQLGRDYDLTYAPVASWESIRMVLALSLRYGWKTKQLDYVLAFPQSPVVRECYMHISTRNLRGSAGIPLGRGRPASRSLYVMSPHADTLGSQEARL
jgi:hypothetical protein